jgi:hypothetical protein
MKSIRASATFAPAAAIVGALSTLACCLPWGIGAALGTLGLSVFFAKFQMWFLVLSLVLLCLGLFQVMRTGRSCSRRRSRAEIALLSISAAIVISIILFPEWVAGLFVGHFR